EAFVGRRTHADIHQEECQAYFQHDRLEIPNFGCGRAKVSRHYFLRRQDEEMDGTGTQRTRELRNPEWHNETPGETPRDGKAQRNCRIEMCGRDIAEGINHSRDS